MSDDDFTRKAKRTVVLAAQGEAWAQAAVGGYYASAVVDNSVYAFLLQQNSVQQNLVEAAKWYKLAVAQGNAMAQCYLGEMYEKGQVVVQDYVEAVRLYRLAAEQGYTKAQENLGAMYSEGLGVPVDWVRACMWFKIAYQGDGGDPVLYQVFSRRLNEQRLREINILMINARSNNPRLNAL